MRWLIDVPYEPTKFPDLENYLTQVLRRMPEGTELTLNDLNKELGFFRIDELRAIVERILRKSFRLFTFTNQKNLGESVILKSYLR